MAGTKAGGQKAARTFKKRTTRRQRRLNGQQGGSAKVKKGFAVSGKAREAGAAGGKARAAKYQDPNFDKGDYRARRAAGLPGTEKPRLEGSSYSPDEHQRRTAANPKPVSKKAIRKNTKRARKARERGQLEGVGNDSTTSVQKSS